VGVGGVDRLIAHFFVEVGKEVQGCWELISMKLINFDGGGGRRSHYSITQGAYCTLCNGLHIPPPQK